MSAPLYQKGQVILAKIEGTEGTDSVPTVGSNAIQVSNLNISPLDQDTVGADVIRPTFGNFDQAITAQRVMVDFEVYLAGSGTPGTAPGWGPLLRACGFSETTVAGIETQYKSISANFESITIYAFANKVLHKLLGARGTVSFDWTVKKLPVMKFKFTGLFSPVTDVTPGTPDFSLFQVPLAVTTANTPYVNVHGFTNTALEMLTADMANAVAHHVLVGQENVLITDRKPTGSISVQASTVADRDWWTRISAATKGPVVITHGTTAGNIVKIYMPRTQITKPSYSFTDNIFMLKGTLTVIPDSGSDSAATSATPSAAGTGYAPSDTITIAGGTSDVPSTFKVLTTKLISAAINAAGTGYVPADTITTTGGTFSAAGVLTVATTKVVSATVAAGGTGGTPGTATVTGTTGTGTKFQANVTISGGGAITAVNSITVAGSYTANPTTLTAEPVTGASLSGATLNVVMGVATTTVSTPGSYTVNAAALTQGATSGTGTGATFNTTSYGVLTVGVSEAGSYTTTPSNPAAQASTSGSGTSATLTVSYVAADVTDMHITVQ